MLKNYLLTAIRNLWRSKAFSFINLTGLAISVALFALIGPRSKKAAGYFESDAARRPSGAQGRRWSW